MHGIFPGMGMGLMAIWWIVGLAVILVVIWMVIRAAGRSSAAPRDDSERILRERYARGEIDREEFERRLADLRR